MKVIGHEHISMNLYVAMTGCASENGQEKVIVGRDAEDRTAVVTALDDVLTESGNEEARAARHPQAQGKSRTFTSPSNSGVRSLAQPRMLQKMQPSVVHRC